MSNTPYTDPFQACVDAQMEFSNDWVNAVNTTVDAFDADSKTTWEDAVSSVAEAMGSYDTADTFCDIAEVQVDQ